MVNEECGHGHNAEVVEGAQFCPLANHHQNHHHHGLQQSNDRPVGLAKQNGGRLDADLQIVIPIDHGIEGVIGDGPEHIGGE